MEMSFNSKLEEYYQKFIELQEKLKKSEEQRFVLEMKFNELVHVAKEEEQAHYKKLRAQYKRFLEEDQKRQDRNERIIRNLERIETKITMLSAKTDRINMFRRQYQNYLRRITNQTGERKITGPTISKERSFIKEEPLKEKQHTLFRDEFSLPERPKQNLDLEKPVFNHPSVQKAFEKDRSNEEKIEILDRYLQSISSQRCRDVLNQEREAREKLSLERPSDRIFNGDFTLDTKNHATAAADDIMNSIYSRYYTKGEDFPKGIKTDVKKGIQNDTNKKPDEKNSIYVEREFKPGDKGYLNSLFSNGNEYKVKENKPSVEFKEANNMININPIASIKQQVDLVKREEACKNENIISDFQNFKNTVNLRENSLKSDITNEPIKNGKDTNYMEPLQNNVDFKTSGNYLMTKVAPGQDHNPEVNGQSQDNKDNHSVMSNEEKKTNNNNFYNKNESGAIAETGNVINKNCGPIVLAGNNQNLQIKDQIKQKCQENPTEDSPSNQLNQHSQQNADNIQTDHQNENIQGFQEALQYTEITNPVQDNKDISSVQYNKTQIQNGDNSLQYDEKEQLILYNKDEQPILSNSNQFSENDQLVDSNQIQTVYDQTSAEPIHSDKTEQEIEYTENKESYQQIQYDENGQPIQFDQNGQQIQYDQNGQPIPYDQNGQLQYDQNGQPIQYDQDGQPFQYDQDGQPIQYDQNGQPIQYDQNGQPIQYDQDGQPIQYDQNDQPIQYDQNGQPIQYDQNGQPIQYNQSGYDQYGQPLLYDQNGQIIQPEYDENGQIIPQYDENGQIISMYDQNGQQYFGNQESNQQQYDANGQPLMQYDENGQPVYDQSQQQYYDYNNQEELQYQGNMYGQNNDSNQGKFGGAEENHLNNRVENVNDQNKSENSDDHQAGDQKYSGAVNSQERDHDEHSGNQYQPEGNDQDQDSIANNQDNEANRLNDLQEMTKQDIFNKEEEKGNTQNHNENNIEEAKPTNVMDILDTDTESAKQNTSKISNDSDFDFS